VRPAPQRAQWLLARLCYFTQTYPDMSDVDHGAVLSPRLWCSGRGQGLRCTSVRRPPRLHENRVFSLCRRRSAHPSRPNVMQKAGQPGELRACTLRTAERPGASRSLLGITMAGAPAAQVQVAGGPGEHLGARGGPAGGRGRGDARGRGARRRHVRRRRLRAQAAVAERGVRGWPPRAALLTAPPPPPSTCTGCCGRAWPAAGARAKLGPGCSLERPRCVAVVPGERSGASLENEAAGAPPPCGAPPMSTRAASWARQPRARRRGAWGGALCDHCPRNRVGRLGPDSFMCAGSKQSPGAPSVQDLHGGVRAGHAGGRHAAGRLVPRAARGGARPARAAAGARPALAILPPCRVGARRRGSGVAAARAWIVLPGSGMQAICRHIDAYWVRPPRL